MTEYKYYLFHRVTPKLQKINAQGGETLISYSTVDNIVVRSKFDSTSLYGPFDHNFLKADILTRDPTTDKFTWDEGWTFNREHLLEWKEINDPMPNQVVPEPPVEEKEEAVENET